jgi:multidrug efflux pump subunit AcrA (membrane-fusion protein)
MARPEPAIRLGMTGDATLSPVAAPARAASAETTFTVPATAIFHQGNSPAVFVVGGRDSTLVLRPITVRSYSDHSAVVASGLKDGDTVVVAGVHSVYAGQRVTVARPLFDGAGDVAGPAPSQGDAGPNRVAVAR